MLASLERWLLRFLVRRQIARGFNDGRELTAMYRMVRDAALEIDSDWPPTYAFLDECFKKSKQQGNRKYEF